MLCEGGEILWDIADLITEEHIRAHSDGSKSYVRESEVKGHVTESKKSNFRFQRR